MILKPGQRYYLRYKSFHVDPAPYLYVIRSDRKYTEGFNLHYLPNIRFRVPLDVYKRVNEVQWKKAFDGLTGIGMFKGFLKFLDDSTEANLSRERFKKIATYSMHKWEWTGLCYRKYHTKLLSPNPNIQYE